jgi:hypothetical protein
MLRPWLQMEVRGDTFISIDSCTLCSAGLELELQVTLAACRDPGDCGC